LEHPSSSSFSFLAPHGPLYLRLATSAERTLAVNPMLTLVSLRQLSEAFARHAAAQAGLLADRRDAAVNQVDLLRALENEVIVDDEAFGKGAFANAGGCTGIDRALGGRLRQVLDDLGDEVWNDAAAA
jgi:hypothetical protein